MFKVLAITALLVAVVFAAPAQEEAPTPYEFQFNEKNENHTLSRTESGDASGVVQGSYTLIDRDGRQRVVNYRADPVNGFTAQIQSNEPGLISSNPAAATYSVQ
ncbi:hypothetical protein TYRP_013036 [Tyrophagus putrescentiae]|nr:hypothetical protein TYRP_013036 [Tyrophagus putrescentiae]